MTTQIPTAMLKRAITMLVFAASPLVAQRSSPVAASRMLWEDVTGYLVQSAKDMPEDKYSFKPTPGVRSFGELIGHVAGAQHMFCAIALGEKPPAEDAVEKAATTKEALVKALQASNDDCRRAYTQSDADASGTVTVFGRQQSRLYVLMMNATHDNEHYGNVVTYLRMNGIVPPSSRPRAGS
jgi:uncharacterized damage-inducible protein DinB